MLNDHLFNVYLFTGLRYHMLLLSWTTAKTPNTQWTFKSWLCPAFIVRFWEFSLTGPTGWLWHLSRLAVTNEDQERSERSDNRHLKHKKGGGWQFTLAGLLEALLTGRLLSNAGNLEECMKRSVHFLLGPEIASQIQKDLENKFIRVPSEATLSRARLKLDSYLLFEREFVGVAGWDEEGFIFPWGWFPISWRCHMSNHNVACCVLVSFLCTSAGPQARISLQWDIARDFCISTATLVCSTCWAAIPALRENSIWWWLWKTGYPAQTLKNWLHVKATLQNWRSGHQSQRSWQLNCLLVL